MSAAPGRASWLVAGKRFRGEEDPRVDSLTSIVGIPRNLRRSPPHVHPNKKRHPLGWRHNTSGSELGTEVHRHDWKGSRTLTDE